MRHPSTIAALLLAALVAGPARAGDGKKPLPVDLSVHEDELYAQVDVSSVFDKKVQEKLTSGLTNHIRITVQLRPLDRDLDELKAPISVTVRECQVAYDLWGERFGVIIDDRGHHRREVLPDYHAVVAACAVMPAVDLAPVGAVDLRREYRLEVKVEVNPEGPADEAASRAYLGDPIGHRRAGDDNGATLFGAVANFFTRDPPDQGDGVTRFESKPFGEAAIRRALNQASHAARAGAGR